MLLLIHANCIKSSLLFTSSDNKATVFPATSYSTCRLSISISVHYSHPVTKCDCISGDMLLYIQIYYTRSSPLFTSSDNNAAMFLATRYCISIILIFRPSFTSSDNNVTVYLATFCCIYIFTMLSPVHYSHPVTIMRPYFWRHATVHTDLIC